MQHYVQFLAIAATIWASASMIAADSVPPQPVPGPSIRPAEASSHQPFTPSTPRRPLPGFEVELVVIEPGTQAKSLARWATLAAEGYRLSQTLAVGTAQYLFLERMAGSQQGQSLPALPSLVESDPALAAETRAKVIATQTRQSIRPGQPGEPPIGRITPVAPAQALQTPPASPAQPITAPGSAKP